ncbi:MAG: DUF530 family protein [Candidatus Anstonellaceae archaeon]
MSDSIGVESTLPSVVLTKEANDFLDELVLSKSSNDQIIEKLSDLKDKMLMMGFNSPFRAMVFKTYREFVENSKSDLLDQKKQKSYFVYLASLKKFTLNRVAVAYAAHKLKNSLEKLGYGYLVEFLPYGGEYRQKLLDIYALESYLYLQELFKPLKLEHQPNKLINFDKHYKIFTRKSLIFKSYASKVALFCAIANFAAKKVKEELNLSIPPEVSEYNKILKSYGFVEDAVITSIENYPNLFEQLKEKKFLLKSKDSFYLDPDLEAKLNKRRNEKKNKTILYSAEILFNLLFDYYLITNLAARESTVVLYSVSPNPPKEHLEVLDELCPQKDFSPSFFLEEKFLLEKQKVPLNPKLVGVSFFCIKANKDPQEMAKRYDLDYQELQEAIFLIKDIIENKDQKLSIFLESLKSEDENDNSKGEEKGNI